MKVYTFAYFRKYILIIAKMKNLNFSFIDIFSSSKEKKKKTTISLSLHHYFPRINDVPRWPPWPRNDGRRAIEPISAPLPPSKPFKRRTTKVIKSSHYLDLDRN